MIKNDYEVRAKKFIKEFAPYLKGIRVCKANKHLISMAVRQFNAEKKRNVKIASGTSRIAFITSDYVIKLDLGTTWAGNSRSEMLAYAQAVQDGYDYLFAKISHYKYRGRNYYIMPKAKIADSYRLSNQRNLWRSLSEDGRKYLDENINDLHNSNWGVIKGKVVIIDYAFNDFR